MAKALSKKHFAMFSVRFSMADYQGIFRCSQLNTR